jgi:hypothetical protein
MPRKKKVKEIVIEPQAAILRTGPEPSADLQAALEGMVRKRVDEILAASATIDAFRPSAVAKTARRVNHIFEGKKWGLYFDKWGCLICGKTAVAKCYFHTGLCSSCGARVQSRLVKIKRDYEAAHPQVEIERNIERLTLRARTAERLLMEDE